MESVEKLVRKYYKPEDKQRRMLEMIHRKLDNLGELEEMNKKFGMYHTVDMLNDSETLFRKCADKAPIQNHGKNFPAAGILTAVSLYQSS